MEWIRHTPGTLSEVITPAARLCGRIDTLEVIKRQLLSGPNSLKAVREKNAC